MAKATPVDGTDGELEGYMVRCPGCGDHHLFSTEHANSVGARWSFNGDSERPTFSPSMLVRSEVWDGNATRKDVCHSFVRDGRIQFLGDCTHELAGKTVPLPDID